MSLHVALLFRQKLVTPAFSLTICCPKTNKKLSYRVKQLHLLLLLLHQQRLKLKMVTRSRNTEIEEIMLSDSEDGGGTTETKRAKTETDAVSLSHYEKIREQRMKENMERMQKLGLLDLSLKLKKTPRPSKKPTTHHHTQSEPLTQRRSSRIMSLPPVSYSCDLPRARHRSTSKEKREVEIYIPEGTNPEVYTEEHEKLLGDCETDWDLYVDGYDEDGDRIFDPNKGEKCHQCGHITLCEYTSCNKCELPQGMLCGDCLYTRYGENVTEANVNPKWTCPACRGICNCNSCRRKNGWMSTGNIYNKVRKLGFKSVAHYLIKTRCSEKSMEGSGAENIDPREIPETFADTTLNRPIRTRRALRS